MGIRVVDWIDTDILIDTVEDDGLLIHLGIDVPVIEVFRSISIAIFGTDTLVQRHIDLIAVAVVCYFEAAKRNATVLPVCTPYHEGAIFEVN